jgi:hypothetical protein
MSMAASSSPSPAEPAAAAPAEAPSLAADASADPSAPAEAAAGPAVDPPSADASADPSVPAEATAAPAVDPPAADASADASVDLSVPAEVAAAPGVDPPAADASSDHAPTAAALPRDPPSPAADASADHAAAGAAAAAALPVDPPSPLAEAAVDGGTAIPPAGAASEDCGPRLRELYPALFSNPPKPIKLRIQGDIQARSPGVFTKPQLSAFLRRYTGSFAYLNALVKAGRRFDLDGNPGDEVSEEHRQAAVDELARRRANHEARVDLERQQRMNRATLLNDFGKTTLTPESFALLKGIPAEELEPLLARARQEATQAPSPPRERGHRGPPPGRPSPGPGQRADRGGERGGERTGERSGERVGERGPRPDRVPGGEARKAQDVRSAPPSPVQSPGSGTPPRRPDAAPQGRAPGDRGPGRNAGGPAPRGPGQPGARPPRAPRPEIGNRKARPEPHAAGGPAAPGSRRDARVEVVPAASRPPTAMAAALAAARVAAASRQARSASGSSHEEDAPAPSTAGGRETET